MPYIGNPAVIGDSTNTFRSLDKISSFTLTFDAASTDIVSVANDTLTFRNHRFVTGQRVVYTDGGGTVITGLADGTAYFIIKVIKIQLNLQPVLQTLQLERQSISQVLGLVDLILLQSHLMESTQNLRQLIITEQKQKSVAHNN